MLLGTMKFAHSEIGVRGIAKNARANRRNREEFLWYYTPKGALLTSRPPKLNQISLSHDC